MPHRAALVSDSASVDEDLATRFDVRVVTLQVVIGAQVYDEGSTAGPDQVAAALRDGAPVSTSRPAPEVFLRTYERAARDGAAAVVSVHLSAEMSGTFESAQLAARRAPLPVFVVDSGQVGMGTGFAVQAAADMLAAGRSAAEAAQAARRRAAQTRSLFYVDTLEFLHRGGRIGTAATLVGSALSVKPLLTIRAGRVVALEKVRTSTRAIARLEEMALAAADTEAVDVAVSHLANWSRAEDLADRLRGGIPGLRELVVNQVGAVVGAHVGPGMLAVVVAPVNPHPPTASDVAV